MYKIKLLSPAVEFKNCISCLNVEKCPKSLGEKLNDFCCADFKKGYVINDYDITKQQYDRIKDILICQK